MVFLNAVQERTAGEAKKLGGVRAVPAVGVECKLDQRALNGAEIDPVGRNDYARTGVGSVRPADANRCMLVAKRSQSHDRCHGKCSTSR